MSSTATMRRWGTAAIGRNMLPGISTDAIVMSGSWTLSWHSKARGNNKQFPEADHQRLAENRRHLFKASLTNSGLFLFLYLYKPDDALLLYKAWQLVRDRFPPTHARFAKKVRHVSICCGKGHIACPRLTNPSYALDGPQ